MGGWRGLKMPQYGGVAQRDETATAASKLVTLIRRRLLKRGRTHGGRGVSKTPLLKFFIKPVVHQWDYLNSLLLYVLNRIDLDGLAYVKRLT